MNTQQIADTILQQLGGDQFIALTGANSFAHGRFKTGPGLSFRLPQTNEHRIFGVRITLGPNDVYLMEFLRFHRRNGILDVEIAASRDDVYCDQLAQIFESETGLATKL